GDDAFDEVRALLHLQRMEQVADADLLAVHEHGSLVVHWLLLGKTVSGFVAGPSADSGCVASRRSAPPSARAPAGRSRAGDAAPHPRAPGRRRRNRAAARAVRLRRPPARPPAPAAARKCPPGGPG